METEIIISARGLAKSYFDGDREHRVLTGIDLDVRAGEFVVILGRSGSGKSTLLNLLGAMDVPGGGTLRIHGVETGQLDESQRTLFRRRQVGFVFQAYNLVPTLSVYENLQLPLELNGVEPASRPPRIEEFLDRLGLDGRGNSYPEHLSGGEQQRVAIARALIHHPALVIADEPTGNLDLETGQQVLALLDETTRAEGRTLVMATHSREVMGIADRVFRIHEGQLRPEIP
ncbi:MAG: ABC transporter ATP-binding protein [Pseudomonadota bacterium]